MPAIDPQLRAAYLALIEHCFGLHLSKDQVRRFDTALWRLLPTTSYPNPHALYQALAQGAERDILDMLAVELTIGETHFFRIRPQIDALQRTVIPDLLTRLGSNRRLRCWSAGCATGEEPYTLAILLREQIPAVQTWAIEILASDINLAALEAGRTAVFREWSFRDTPDHIRSRHFVPQDKNWRLAESVRAMVHFRHLNLADEAALAREIGRATFDLILCRNVTIYFSPRATQTLYQRIVEALMPGGWLILGPSDPTPSGTGDLAPIFLPDAVLWRRPLDEPAPVAHPPRAAKARSELRRKDIPTRPAAAPAPRKPVGDSDATHRDRAVPRAQPAPASRPGAPADLDCRTYLVSGLELLEAGEFGRAVEELRRAIFIDSSSPLARFSLGRAYLRLGERSRALAAIRQAGRLLERVPDDEPVPHGDGLLAGELRHAVATQLGVLQS
jgi:chemotaxis protein methyltransferase CheR